MLFPSDLNSGFQMKWPEDYHMIDSTVSQYRYKNFLAYYDREEDNLESELLDLIGIIYTGFRSSGSMIKLKSHSLPGLGHRAGLSAPLTFVYKKDSGRILKYFLGQTQDELSQNIVVPEADTSSF